MVSSLWLFVVLCYLYCDVVGLFDPEHLRQLAAGSIDGLEVTQSFLFAAGVLMTIPTAMVLVSRIAPHRVARWGTVVAATVMTVVQAGTLLVGSVTAYYAYFSVIEIATTAFLVQYAVRTWRTDD